MNSAIRSAQRLKGEREESAGAPRRDLRGLARRSALLNFGIVLTALPIAVVQGGPAGLIVALPLLAVVSMVVWSATFAISASVSIFRIFRGQVARMTPSYSRAAGGGGVGDEWLDGIS